MTGRFVSPGILIVGNGGSGVPGKIMTHEGRQTNSEQRKRKTGSDLIGLQVEREKPERKRQGDAGGRRRYKAYKIATRGKCSGETGDRPNQHHSFDAEIEDPGFLDDCFAERGINKRRSCHDRGCYHRDQRVHAVLFAVTADFASTRSTGRTYLSRKVINRSAASK